MHDIIAIRVDDAIRVALARGASDVHFAPASAPLLRVDGLLEPLPGAVLIAPESHLIARHLLGEAGLEKLAREGDVSAAWDGCKDALIRVHAFTAGGETHVALRLLNRTVPEIERLHLPNVVTALAAKPRGLILFAGPTGSGKSTSLASLVARINQDCTRRVITIEEPIEYRFARGRSAIVQREVGRDVPSFSQAVMGALRSDPDVIMIGEMRDSATMRAAITAAETGHLVLSTLHTGDAIQTIDRIVDAFEGAQQAQVRSQLAASLVAVVCQRLVPMACGTGRRVAAEVLVATDAARTMIRESRTHQLRNVMMTGRAAGMQTLEAHLSALLSEGIIRRRDAEVLCERCAELPEAALA